MVIWRLRYSDSVQEVGVGKVTCFLHVITRSDVHILYRREIRCMMDGKRFRERVSKHHTFNLLHRFVYFACVSIISRDSEPNELKFLSSGSF